jgi:acetyl-CoA C-acetyltransferase
VSSRSTGVAILGIGIHPFGRTDGVSGRQQAVHATRQALGDAGIGWDQAQFAFGGSRDGGDADTLVNELGLTGLPFVNVWNGCATGGSALAMADRTIRAGAADLGLAIGFDKHPRGAFNVDPETMGIGTWYGETGLMLTTQFFAMKIQRYMRQHGITPSTLAKVAVKATKNGSENPNAWRRTPMTEEQVAGSPMVSDPLTQFMFCSPGEGAVALVLCRADRAREYTDTPVFLDTVSFVTRHYGSFEVFSPWLAPERADGPTVEAAKAAFEQAGIGPEDVDVAQLYDCFTITVLMQLEDWGFCAKGEGGPFAASGALGLTGSLPINTGGGHLSEGYVHGMNHVVEGVRQIRGESSNQVPGAETCLVACTPLPPGSAILLRAA